MTQESVERTGPVQRRVGVSWLGARAALTAGAR
jgi:hypothetical protein